MAPHSGPDRQTAFSKAMAELLRQSRKRQRLTQAEVAARTGGIVSKAALANYEAGLRSLRIDIFWLLAKALGEDAGVLLGAAERGSGLTAEDSAEPITIDVDAVQSSSDPRLDPVRRWFALRLQRNGTRLPVRAVTLDTGALAALAQLMRVSPEACRSILSQLAVPERGESGGGSSSAPTAQAV